ncbi:MAG: HAMP domain-containing sensor histidine kinase [Arcanobacterium sp.]|nr:HAMP domain-containing sensor histidine kinase [Arcanobacterium sp.]
MRRRAIQMTSAAVAVAVLMLGIPAIIFGTNSLWSDAEQQLGLRAKSVAGVIERRESEGIGITASAIEPQAWYSDSIEMFIEYQAKDGSQIVAGDPPPDTQGFLISSVSTRSGGTVTVGIDRNPIMMRSILLVLGTMGLIIASFVVGVLVALRQSRKLSAPLIYLAASAEQIGGALVRPQVKPTGIEEIDLVNQELQRSADRIAARIAAERQFAAAAAHQLRTPLTALSMRVEEIQYLAQDPEIAEEAEQALGQIERLGGVIEELMNAAKLNNAGTNEVVSIDEIFHQQQDEWRKSFAAVERDLRFSIRTDALIIATPGSISQIIATLIENSLKYGAGTTSVTAEKSTNMVVIRVRDEGLGVSEELAPIIFNRGVSAGGSSGIGLPVAKELASVNGGRLELTNRESAEFTLTLRAMPASLDPHRLVPQGASYTVGARRKRR